MSDHLIGYQRKNGEEKRFGYEFVCLKFINIYMRSLEGSCCLLSDKVAPSLMPFHALFKMIFSLPLRKLLSFIAFVFFFSAHEAGYSSIFTPVVKLNNVFEVTLL